MAFLQWVFPILDSISSVICAKIEIKKGNANLKISQINKEINKLGNDDDEKKAYQIGFAIDTDDEEDEETDDNFL